MAKLFGIGGNSLVEYLTLIVDNDWKEGDKNMGIREKKESPVAPKLKLPDEERWQFRSGRDRFWAGDSLRAANSDTAYSDSRRIWRKGWVSACKEYLKEKGYNLK